MNSAANCLQQGDLNGALAAFSQAIGQDPTNAQAFYKRGLVYEKLKELLKSYGDFEKACSLDPDNKEYSTALSRVVYQDAPNAIDDTWDEAIKLKKRQQRESLSKQFPYRLAGSVFSVFILAGYWLFVFRTRKPSQTPRDRLSQILKSACADLWNCADAFYYPLCFRHNGALFYVKLRYTSAL